MTLENRLLKEEIKDFLKEKYDYSGEFQYVKLDTDYYQVETSLGVHFIEAVLVEDIDEEWDCYNPPHWHYMPHFIIKEVS